jgi:hypothetical protein
MKGLNEDIDAIIFEVNDETRIMVVFIPYTQNNPESFLKSSGIKDIYNTLRKKVTLYSQFINPIQSFALNPIVYLKNASLKLDLIVAIYHFINIEKGKAAFFIQCHGREID